MVRPTTEGDMLCTSIPASFTGSARPLKPRSGAVALAWSIPKGEFEAGEDPLTAARREFTEETGFAIDGDFLPLAPIKQPSGKVVYTWIVPGDYDAALVRSNTFTLRGREYPEVDRAAWFDLAQARRKILRGQLGFLDELEHLTRERATDRGDSGAPDSSRGPS